MLKQVNEIIKAQDCLKIKYGERDYQRFIVRMKARSNNDLLVLSVIAKDKTMHAEVRLIAIACMGE